MSSFLPNTMENPEPRWEKDEPTGPIEPLVGLSESPVDDPNFRRVRRNPWLVFVVVLVITFLVFLGIGITGHRVLTGSWGLPWVKEYPPLPSISATAAPPVAASPTATPQAPPPQAAPPGPIAQAVPTRIVVRRDQRPIISSEITGAYTPSGSTVDPPGNKPYWLSASSQVGDGMTIPAVIVGHAMNGNADMPFGALGEVQPGDMVDLTVPGGVITFQADPIQTPDKSGMVEFGPEPDTVKLVSCDLIANRNVVVSAHRVS